MKREMDYNNNKIGKILTENTDSDTYTVNELFKYELNNNLLIISLDNKIISEKYVFYIGIIDTETNTVVVKLTSTELSLNLWIGGNYLMIKKYLVISTVIISFLCALIYFIAIFWGFEFGIQLPFPAFINDIIPLILCSLVISILLGNDIKSKIRLFILSLFVSLTTMMLIITIQIYFSYRGFY